MQITIIKASASKPKTMASCPWIVEIPPEPAKQ
jgi:hypothetical protein